MTAVAEKPCTLYRYFDASGNLLYVGISLNAITRASQHRTAPWYRLYSSSTAQHFASRAEAAAAEVAAIQTERPIFNVQHVVKAAQKKSKKPAKSSMPARERKGPYINGTPREVPRGHPWGYYHSERVFRLMRIAPDALEAVQEVVSAYHEYRRSGDDSGCALGFYESRRPDGESWRAYADRIVGTGRLAPDTHLAPDDRAWLRGDAWGTVRRLLGENAPECDCEHCKELQKLNRRSDMLLWQGFCPGCERRRGHCTCLEDL